jgi:hypothetical protein
MALLAVAFGKPLPEEFRRLFRVPLASLGSVPCPLATGDPSRDSLLQP